MKVALLSRISTSDQSNDSALEELKRVALNKGFDIYDVYEEVVSGAKGIEEREQLQRLLSDAKKGCFYLNQNIPRPSSFPSLEFTLFLN